MVDASPEFVISGRRVGSGEPPLVIAEIGINHDGNVNKAFRMIEDAATAGCECVKFQTHIVDDEMIPNDIIPGNANESIWNIMQRCTLSAREEADLKRATEEQGMIFLSTPFSRAAADRLHRLGVSAFKIGSGECNNYPLVKHIAGFGKPVILSTGMNNLSSIAPSVRILREAAVPFALLHCTSIYPTPYSLVRLGAITSLGKCFPDAVLGLSDHSLGIYTCLAAVTLGARVLEKHFTSDRTWPGPDNNLSLEPSEMSDLVTGARAIFDALGGEKRALIEEQPIIKFAYASVVSTRHITAGEMLSWDNIWVKRPGTGEILAADYDHVIGRRVVLDIPRDHQLRWRDLED